ncbi:hypothetical protein [Pedobacter xixiisoli]|uniref:Uncharacterized protein n=1 Tax=Pedobacter xixiisoli TaxID=1476464 RepID=A0A285ZZY6_9SPHI|nr:hypothetical protein [Pedobacter xixiisoli]SOD15200.1 hypothetical protein SAMN06297358_2178 [Pedobacter xixiisoli]
MRNILAKASLFCLILFTFSCAKDTERLTAPTKSFIKAQIGGQAVEFTTATKAIYNVGDKKTVEITAFTPSGKMIGFVIDGFTGPRSYEITESMLTTFSYIGDIQDFDTYFISTSGTITITQANDNLIVGKFEVIANNGTEDISISNGDFSIDLNTAETHEHLGDNKFSAKLNGVLTGFKGQVVAPGIINIIGMYGTKSMTLALPSYTGVGTYQLSDTFLGDRLSYFSSADEPEYISTSGTAIVTSTANNTIKGTFSGTLTNDNGETIVVTDGNFEIKEFN